MTRKLNVAIVGCGQISDSHIKSWKNIRANIVAVCDTNASLAKSKAEKWGILRYYEDVSEMVKEENLGAVSVCTPANVRLNVVKPIIEMGVNVVIEKPFAMSSTEAEKMIVTGFVASTLKMVPDDLRDRIADFVATRLEAN